MPRSPRIHVPGGIYHVILRGNFRQAVFFGDLDRRRWMRLLARGIDRYRCRIHAYCWMTNHVHLAVQVADIPLGRFVGWVASQYARSVNKRLERSGHLFERRYRGILVDNDAHLLQLLRYIHRNPLTARIVDNLDRYPWSSHRAYLGYYRPGFLTTDLVLGLFSSDRQRAQLAYRNFMEVEDDTPLAQGSIILTDDAQVANDHLPLDPVVHGHGPHQKPSLSELIAEHCRAYDISEADLRSPRRTRQTAKLRAEIAISAQRLGIATLHDVAVRFSRSDSALGHAIRNMLDSRRRPKQ